MKFRHYTIEDSVAAQARSQGVYGETKRRVLRMARRSSAVTSEFGNRRFLDFILAIEGEAIQQVTRIN